MTRLFKVTSTDASIANPGQSSEFQLQTASCVANWANYSYN